MPIKTASAEPHLCYPWSTTPFRRRARASMLLTFAVFILCLFVQTQSFFLHPHLPRLSPPHQRLMTPHGAHRMMMSSKPSPTEADVVVIGSGIGGLSCASVLATYGMRVVVCESHYHAGGAAHGFEIDGFKFDSGPSLFSGISLDRSPNPLKHVLDFIGESDSIKWINYDTWGICLPEGKFDATIGPEPFQNLIGRFGGPNAKTEWDRLMVEMEPLSEGAMALPPAVLRGDAGVILTLLRFLGGAITSIKTGPKLQQPFSKLVDEVGITDPFLRNWLSLLCFLLQGMPPSGTMTAVMAYMLADWYRPGVQLDYPAGGTGAIVDALANGVKKRGGEILLRAHVQEILTEGGKAVGVKLKDGRVIKAGKAVVSNASIWDTLKLINPKDIPEDYPATVGAVPQTPSFLHLHVGIDATGMEENLQCHYAVVDDWSLGIEAPGNVVIISIPSVLDPSLAPEGCHTIHVYSAGNEPYAPWHDLERNSEEYRRKKGERAEVLWRALEKAIPDVRKRVKLSLAGTPLTHERFLRRNRGTYGPAIRAGQDTYPSNKPPLEGLLLCGDSVFPGIGIPAVAASGTIAANSLVSVWRHQKLLNTIRM